MPAFCFALTVANGELGEADTCQEKSNVGRLPAIVQPAPKHMAHTGADRSAPRRPAPPHLEQETLGIPVVSNTSSTIPRHVRQTGLSAFFPSIRIFEYPKSDSITRV